MLIKTRKQLTAYIYNTQIWKYGRMSNNVMSPSIPHLPIRVFPKCFTEFAEFSDKNNIILKRGLLYHTPFCVRNRDSTTVPQTQLTEETVKLILLIHASVDSLNSLNSVKSVSFRENPIKFVNAACFVDLLLTVLLEF